MAGRARTSPEPRAGLGAGTARGDRGEAGALGGGAATDDQLAGTIWRMNLRGVTGVVVAASLASSGCTVGALMSYKTDPVSSESINIRPSSRQADLSGQSCYVDRQERVHGRVRVDRIYLALGGLEMVFGALIASLAYGPDPQSPTGEGKFVFDSKAAVGGLMVLDGLFAAVIALRDGKVTTRDRWTQTTETTTCAP